MQTDRLQRCPAGQLSASQEQDPSGRQKCPGREQLVSSQMQARPLQRCPAGQLPSSQVQVPSGWQTCPGAAQTSPEKAGFVSQRPVVVSQVWQIGQAAAQAHEPQSTGISQLLGIWPHRPAHVRAADSGLQPPAAGGESGESGDDGNGLVGWCFLCFRRFLWCFFCAWTG